MWLQLVDVGSSALHIGYFCALFDIPRHENCALLGYHAASSGKKLPRVMGRNYHQTLRNYPKERSSQLLRGGSLQWCPPRLATVATVYQTNIINCTVLHVVYLSTDVDLWGVETCCLCVNGLFIELHIDILRLVGNNKIVLKQDFWYNNLYCGTRQTAKQN